MRHGLVESEKDRARYAYTERPALAASERSQTAPLFCPVTGRFRLLRHPKSAVGCQRLEEFACFCYHLRGAAG